MAIKSLISKARSHVPRVREIHDDLGEAHTTIIDALLNLDNDIEGVSRTQDETAEEINKPKPPEKHAETHYADGDDPVDINSIDGFLDNVAEADQFFLRADRQWAQVEATVITTEDEPQLANSRTLIAGDNINLELIDLGRTGSQLIISADVPAAGADLTYHGDYIPATYNDGDIVVGADGITYMCVVDGTTTPPEPWPVTSSGIIPAHAVNHNTGGNDPITALSGDIIASGTIADARLTPNVLKHTGGYPGGTTNFLREDGTFAAPPLPTNSGVWTSFIPYLTSDPSVGITIDQDLGTVYTIIGKTMIVSCQLHLTLAGPTTTIHLWSAIGVGAAQRHVSRSVAWYYHVGPLEGTGVVSALPGDARLLITKTFIGNYTGYTWAAGQYYIAFTHSFSIP